jgi:hypothetical protein
MHRNCGDATQDPKVIWPPLAINGIIGVYVWVVLAILSSLITSIFLRCGHLQVLSLTPDSQGEPKASSPVSCLSY